MFSLKYNNVVIESLAVNLPPIEVTSAEIEDRLAPVYQKLGIPFGTLEKLSGVASRSIWPPEVMPSHAATQAVKNVLELSNIKPEQIKALISCSVARDFFEPSVASLVHSNLGLSEQSICFDVTNACIGFSDGISVVANLIESGAIEAGVVVSAETAAKMADNTLKYLLNKEDLSREEFLKLLPTFTLGCSSVAYVLCNKNLAPEGHAIKAIVSRSATQFADLCVGNADFCMTQKDDFNPIMETESTKLIGSAAKVGGRAWQDLKAVVNWSKDDVTHVFCHQVGKQVNENFYKEIGLDYAKEYTLYRKYGNPVSAALPTALVLGAQEKPLKGGDKVVLMAFGSGLNCRFVAIEW